MHSVYQVSVFNCPPKKRHCVSSVNTLFPFFSGHIGKWHSLALESVHLAGLLTSGKTKRGTEQAALVKNIQLRQKEDHSGRTCDVTYMWWYSLVVQVHEFISSVVLLPQKSHLPRPQHPQLMDSGKEFQNGTEFAARDVSCQDKYCREGWEENKSLKSHKLIWSFFKAAQENLKYEHKFFFTWDFYNTNLCFRAYLVLCLELLNLS